MTGLAVDVAERIVRREMRRQRAYRAAPYILTALGVLVAAAVLFGAVLAGQYLQGTLQ